MRNLQKLAAGALEEVLAGAALHQVLPPRLQQLKRRASAARCRTSCTAACVSSGVWMPGWPRCSNAR